ncbi:MAG: phosphatase PAP2 family protein [Bacteroidota bacterium]
MKKIIKDNFSTISIYFLLLVCAGGWLLNDGKVQIHQSINDYVGNPYLDYFFKYITHLGDGISAILIIIIMLFIHIKKSIYILLSYVSSALITSIIKNFIYLNTCRPAFCFQYYAGLPLKVIEGVKLNSFNSFPSGHATTAFAIFISFMLLSKHNFYKLLWFCLALITAFSRTYLSQHWLVDVYFGSIIGFVFAVIFYLFFYLRNKSYNLNNGILNLVEKERNV